MIVPINLLPYLWEINVELTKNGHVRFIQVFESNEGTIYRLAAQERIDLDASSITVRFPDAYKADPAVYVLEDASDPVQKCSSGSIFSLRLDGAPEAFEVLYRGRPLAKMTPPLFARLVTMRNFSMVNPSIDGAYHGWLQSHDARLREACAVPFPDPFKRPLISVIVPLYRTPIRYFHDMVSSVLGQTYEALELVLVNASPDDRPLAEAIASYQDKRIRSIEVPENRGIAGNTNIGIKAAQGDFIAFFDHDDVLDPRALEMYVRTLADHPDTDLLYCDEDNFHESLDDRYSPLLKPNFNLDLLYSHNYVVHLLMVSKWALGQVELSPDATSGAQDYDLTLKISEIARHVEHVPFILYHWRAHPGSTNGGVMETKPYAIAASVRALDDHFSRRGVSAQVTPTNITCVFDADFSYDGTEVSIIQPFRGTAHAQTAIRWFSSLQRQVNAELILIGPPTDMRGTREKRVTAIDWTEPYDFCRMANAAAIHAKGEQLLICRSVPYDPTSNFLSRLCGCLEQRNEVGIAAPKLFYPDGLIQHAGIYVTSTGSVGFLNRNFTDHMGGGYHGYAECSCDYSAIGPECFLIRAEDYSHVGMLDEHYGNDLISVIDLCFKMRNAGKTIAVLPHAKATVEAPVWHEDGSAASLYGSPQALSRLWNQWGDTWKCDVLFNPGVTFEHGYPGLNVKRDIQREARRSHQRALLQSIKNLLRR